METWQIIYFIVGNVIALLFFLWIGFKCGQIFEKRKNELDTKQMAQ
jgi:hypothetical protein